VLALHGAMMDAKLMESFTGLSATADKHGFIVVYPNGTGPGGVLQTWNAGLFPGELNKKKADDVKYLAKVLDDVEGACNVDKKRVYVTGLSNGGMMSYRLASELADRIAAIAPVAGTMAVEKYAPSRPVSVVQFHGTKDTFVPFNGSANKKDAPAYLRFRSVDDTIKTCLKANECHETAKETEIAMTADKVKVIRKDYGKGKDGAEVVLYVIENGGHTWPGMTFSLGLLGLSTNNIRANEVMWEFFRRHALK
jgi:polyhydroxybutyrate depolymerase